MAGMLPDILELLSDMIRIDSRNTMPLEAKGERPATEERMGLYVESAMKRLGMDVEKQYIAPGRPNVIGYRACGVPGARTMGFNAHLDTVGTDGMKIDPFDPVVKDGLVFGRGSCDTKASLAAMLKAVEGLVAGNVPVNVLFVASASEETGCQGSPLLKLDKWPCDGFIVGEPTCNCPVVFHKCQGAFDLVCRGRSAHSSRPELGDNAIIKAARLLCWLADECIPGLEKIGSPNFERGCTLSPDIIAGGVKSNIVADCCRITCDIRLVPEAGDARAVFERIANGATEALGFPVELENTQVAAAMETPLDNPFVETVRRAVRSQGLDDAPKSVAYCTDGGQLSSMGFPCVVLGPGDIGVAHSEIEYCPIEQLAQAAGIYEAAARGLAGLPD